MNMDELIRTMTLEEKAALLQGDTCWTTRAIPRLGIPPIFLADGPHGLRRQAHRLDHLGLNESLPATCFPTAATMANSWDVELGRSLGRALGEEAASQEVHVVLGPGLNMKRSPLCGRNFEYFSEDPYLAGKMAAAYINGIQFEGVAACPKHFAVNSQELRRMSMDAVVDQRTLREIYLTGFEIAVKEGKPKAIMSSYNQVNGTYANEHPQLLTGILRNDWGFDGFVVTDWGADNDHVEGVRAGSDLVMPGPGPDTALTLIEAVRSGRLPETELDQRLKELLPVIFEVNTNVARKSRDNDVAGHHALARRCAEESIVLLENDGILPLAEGTRVAVVGDFATTPRYQGAGSSRVNPTVVETLSACLPAGGLTVTGYAPGYRRNQVQPDEALIAQAVEITRGAQVVLLCVGLDDNAECEGADRQTLNLPESQNALIRAVCASHENVVLVLSGGAPFLMPDRRLYRAAIHGYLSGQAGGSAMVSVLTGKCNPSGKLAETWPLALEDTPCYRYFPSRQKTSEYREGLFIGYRYYDTAGVPVRYPFGHGLSYTSFEYSGIQADWKKVSFTLTNTGKRDGAEVVQIYVGCRGSAMPRPAKELKAFTKVFLRAGESRVITVPLDDKTFRYFNTATGRWETEQANYDVMVAASAADVKLTATIRVFGTGAAVPDKNLPSYRTGRIKDVPDREFEALLGHPIPDGNWGGQIQENDALCQLYYAKGFTGKLIYKILNKKMKKAQARGDAGTDILYVFNMPLRALVKMSGGQFTAKMLRDLLKMINGHFFRGFFPLIGHYFQGRSQAAKFKKLLK